MTFLLRASIGTVSFWKPMGSRLARCRMASSLPPPLSTAKISSLSGCKVANVMEISVERA